MSAMDEQGMNEKNRAICFLQQRPINVFSRAFEKQNTYFETASGNCESPTMLTLSVVEFEVTTVTEIVVQHSRSSSRASGAESPAAIATPSKDTGANSCFEPKTRRSSVSSPSTTMDDPRTDGDATQGKATSYLCDIVLSVVS
ncbi:hypothetical protein MRX96_026010 [Rhipicephalus microplus]